MTNADPASHGEVVSLKEFLLRIIAERDALYAERAKADSERVRVALEQLDHRLAGVNEFRQMIEAIVSEKASRGEVEQRFLSLVDKVEVIRGSAEGRPSKGEMDQRLNGLADRLDSLEKRLDRTDGAASGRVTIWGVVVAVVMIVIGIAAIWLRSK